MVAMSGHAGQNDVGGKVVVAMSGGVDSSVAAWLLQQQGYEVVGLFMRVGVDLPADACRPNRQGCCSAADAADARAIAGQLGISFYALNFKEQFDDLIEMFAAEYARGRTPNPCILCNERFKFGRLAEYADAIGAQFVATGHYARMIREGGRTRLARGVDGAKDQSYVLFSVPQSVLDRVVLPIGDLSKAQVRAYARDMGLGVHDKPDSQEICFAPDNDYARIVAERQPDAFQPGPVRHVDGRVVGEHGGLAHYTIGQRRGLGIAMGDPVYVVALDVASNTVVVGPREALLHRGVTASRLNWLMDPPAEAVAVTAQIRYRHQAGAARLEPVHGDRLRLVFDEPQPAITPGQAVVVYQGATVWGGGWIDASFDA